MNQVNPRPHDQSDAQSESAEAQRGTASDDAAAVSEAGSGAMNSETGLGGADSVPDTPDINDTGEADGIDTSEAEDRQGRA